MAKWCAANAPGQVFENDRCRFEFAVAKGVNVVKDKHGAYGVREIHGAFDYEFKIATNNSESFTARTEYEGDDADDAADEKSGSVNNSNYFSINYNIFVKMIVVAKPIQSINNYSLTNPQVI